MCLCMIDGTALKKKFIEKCFKLPKFVDLDFKNYTKKIIFKAKTEFLKFKKIV